MNFRLADTFTAALGRLTNAEQKAVKTTAFDLQINPASPGLSVHRLDRAKDPNFWSLRVNDDIRIIVHRQGESVLLAYVGHHDEAYRWAERRKLERHPTTGAMQIVEIRERVETAPAPDDGQSRKGARLFDNLTRAELMAFGVPAEWVDVVRAAATEDAFFETVAHLPQEAQEALLTLAVGERPAPAATIPAQADPFGHPDAARRFRLLEGQEELARALDYPWDRWAVFLHPDQRRLVERRFNGPARVSGSAGTGKTIVALHRAVHLARANPDARVLLTTFSKVLANALAAKLERLAGNEPDVMARMTVKPIKAVGYDLYAAWFGQPNLAPPSLVARLLADAAAAEGVSSTVRFLEQEWSEVVDAWQVDSEDAYRDVPRRGRKTRLGANQRGQLWSIFDRVRHGLRGKNMTTWPAVFAAVTDRLAARSDRPFEFAVVDEAQDLAVAEARFLAALAAARTDGLFFSGDFGQRIFQQTFSWKALGIDVRGRSQTLKVNYRTSHQIRTHADRLLPLETADADGETDTRHGTISVFDGPAPEVVVLEDADAEIAHVGAWIAARMSEEIGAVDNVKYDNYEPMERAYIAGTLQPRWIELEERLNRGLLSPEERLDYFLDFDRSAVELADVQKQQERIFGLIDRGAITLDEARMKLGWNPLPNKAGEVRVVPGNATMVDENNEVVFRAGGNAPDGATSEGDGAGGATAPSEEQPADERGIIPLNHRRRA